MPKGYRSENGQMVVNLRLNEKLSDKFRELIEQEEKRLLLPVNASDLVRRFIAEGIQRWRKGERP